MRRAIRFFRNNRLVTIDDDRAAMTLLDWLRLDERAPGTKEGCAEGDCGACTVVLARLRDGRIVHEPVNACILLAGQADGAQVITIEDLAGPGGELDPVQEAMVRHHGSQCGFCTPGIVMSLYALRVDGARPVTRQAACDQLAGNLCRCTGYRPIVDAALEACAAPPTDPEPWTAAQLADDDDVLIASRDGASFFAAPRSERALAELCLEHPDARIVAGATDVGLAFTKGLEQTGKVIWLGRVAGLDAIRHDGTALALGATVSLARALPHLAAIDPDLGEVMRRFGSVQVRASGTVGGNIANGSPIGDLAPCLIALGASLELARGEQRREIELEHFFLGYRRQDRRAGEYLRQVHIPLPAANVRFRALKVSKRMDEDISAVLGAFALVVEGNRIASARIAYGGMAGVPARAPKTEAAITGARLDNAASWQPAIECIAQDFKPLDDHRASAAYRVRVAANLLRKALIEISGTTSRETRIVPRREVADAAE